MTAVYRFPFFYTRKVVLFACGVSGIFPYGFGSHPILEKNSFSPSASSADGRDRHSMVCSFS